MPGFSRIAREQRGLAAGVEARDARRRRLILSRGQLLLGSARPLKQPHARALTSHIKTQTLTRRVAKARPISHLGHAHVKQVGFLQIEQCPQIDALVKLV